MHVVLVLADADGLGVHLDQLRQRVLEAAGNRDGAAHGEVEVGELLAGDIACRVHGCAGLADHDDEGLLDLAEVGQDVAAEIGGLAAVRSVADGDGGRRVLGDELLERLLRVRERALALHEVHERVGDELAGVVHDDALAAGALARVDAEDHLAAERRHQEELLHVLGEHAHGVLVGGELQLDAQIALECGAQEPRERLVDRALEGLCERGRFLHLREARELGGGALAIDVDARAQHTLGLAAADGQEAVGRERRRLLLEVVVHLEFGGLLRLRRVRRDAHEAVLRELLADERADLGALGEDLGHDVTCAGERRLGVGDLLRRVHELACLCRDVTVRRLGEDAQRQGLEPALPRDHGARAALRLEGGVEILEGGLHPSALDLGAQLGGELPLALDLGQDRRLAIEELAVVGALLLDVADLHLVEAARLLLPVAGDERDAGAFREQLGDRADAGDGEGELLGDAGGGIVGDGLGHALPVYHARGPGRWGAVRLKLVGDRAVPDL